MKTYRIRNWIEIVKPLSPRMPVLADDEIAEDANRALAPLRQFGALGNIFRMLAQSPSGLAAFLGWGAYIVGPGNSLPARERQLLTLRIAFLAGSSYAWASHARLAVRIGVPPETVQAVQSGAAAGGWSAREAALLAAADEIVASRDIGDALWSDLARLFSERERLDATLTAAHFTQVSIITRVLRVPPDGATPPDASKEVAGK